MAKSYAQAKGYLAQSKAATKGKYYLDLETAYQASIKGKTAKHGYNYNYTYKGYTPTVDWAVYDVPPDPTLFSIDEALDTMLDIDKIKAMNTGNDNLDKVNNFIKSYTGPHTTMPKHGKMLYETTPGKIFPIKGTYTMGSDLGTLTIEVHDDLLTRDLVAVVRIPMTGVIALDKVQQWLKVAITAAARCCTASVTNQDAFVRLLDDEPFRGVLKQLLLDHLANHPEDALQLALFQQQPTTPDIETL